MPKNMGKNVMDYALRTQLDLPYEQAIERVVAALKNEGFGVLTQVDVKATLKKKLDVDFRKYAILGACNPPLAYQSLQAEIEIGLLLPCNVIVYEQDDGCAVSILHPIAMMDVIDNPALKPVAEEARARLQRVVDALSQGA